MLRVLLVEDNVLHLSMMARRLTVEGFQVTAATNGAQALALARSDLPDIVLLDMDLPIMTGWETARHLRQVEETRAMPIIALTGHTGDAAREQCLEAGCSEFEPKPIDFRRLVNKMRLLLGLRESVR